ncbi:MAG: RdgB/HAM1 family non-canonical purine NTP pyrophosphatase [Pseudorhodobacter sp.]|nr:MAG: RdgB/HAM1 family non-canonical purine NTP pyrophosphatase [Pseudorhodobacter sp.]
MTGIFGDKLVLATHNAGKIEEFVSLLSPYGVTVLSASDFGIDAPEETETTFIGNARIKARHVSALTGLPSLADDSGIEIDALGGAPGVYTADWAETPHGRDFLVAMERAWGMVRASGKKPPFNARFCCTLVLAMPDGGERVFEGFVGGQLVWPIRGALGHGYDPMFQPNGQPLTFAEMTPEAKNAISHRAVALRKFCDACFT